jgi:hypothetical protein
MAVHGRGRTEELTKVNDKLANLQAGDPLLPPDLDASSTLEVVPVHDNMNGQVQCDWHPRHRGSASELREAEEGGGRVVIGVEKSERLLLDHQEDGVDKLDVLGDVVELNTH